MTERSLEAVLDAVRERVTPGPDERERLDAAADTALERAREAVDERGLDATVELVGSAGRD
ncbi:MAG: tRNA CCA-pyrophosphorylase, partial [Actinobacteria bacterium]|nr:tRNA CCA-pyrophosphorylase [Actinomycetota bacterium]NIU66056.1 tRNA CCA-pyrophosphorylase [Actinomycetota bacterium]NIW27862.1 tRNA CCA-pyrophosphorylase [Actinomycetota bacterium]